MNSRMGSIVALSFLSVLLLTFASVCCGVSVAVVAPGGSPGVFAITQELLLRGHNVRVVVEETNWDSCRERVGSFFCVTIPPLEITTMEQGMSEELSALVSRSVTKRSFKPDVLVADVSLRRVVDAIAEEIQKPAVFVLGGSNAIRSQSADNQWTVPMGIAQKVESGWKNALQTQHVIVPFPFGVGFPDAYRCPNVHLVGFLPERLVARQGLPDSVNRWMDACRNGLIFTDVRADVGVEMYVRTVAALNQLSFNRNICVVWSNLRTDLLRESKPTSPLFLPVGKDVDRETLLGRNETRFFITSTCGSETLEAAAQSETVLVVLDNSRNGNPACDHLSSSALGIVIDAEKAKYELYDHFNNVWNNTAVAANMRRLFRLNHLLGGPSKAAQVVETVAALGQRNTDFFCDWPSDWVRKYDFDALFVTGGVIACSAFVLINGVAPGLLWLLRREWRN